MLTALQKYVILHFEHFKNRRGNSHILHGDVLEDLAVVDVPHRLVVPHLGRQQDGPQHDAFPVGGANVNLRVGQEPLQVHLGGQTPGV